MSSQPPVTEAVALSGPEKLEAESQVSIPEVASVPLQLIVSGLVYQPFALAERLGLAETTGAVPSYSKLSCFDAEFPALSWQVPVNAAVPLSGPEYDV